MGNNSIKFCCKVNCTPKDRGVKTGVSGSAPSQGYVIRQVEILSNKLLATAFEASLGCMSVTPYAKRRQQGNRDSY